MGDSPNEKSSSVSWSPKCIELMHAGVTITDPGNTIIEPDVEVDSDTTIFPGCQLRGKTHIGSFCKIGPYAVIIDSEIGERSTVKTSSWLEGVQIGANVTIEPFQRLTASKE